MGQSAIDFVDTIEKGRRPVENAEEIWSATMGDIREGTAASLQDRQATDEQYGKGSWRPLPRHVIWQGIATDRRREAPGQERAHDYG